MPEVRIEHISKQYGAVPVLRNFSLTIHDGEFFTLVGPSGCGKTTLINLVAGLDELDSGEIYFDDRPISHLAPKDRNVAMVFQHDGLYPHLTIGQSLRFALKGSVAATEMEARVDEAVGLTRIEAILNRYPSRLSGGELRRAATWGPKWCGPTATTTTRCVSAPANPRRTAGSWSRTLPMRAIWTFRAR